MYTIQDKHTLSSMYSKNVRLTHTTNIVDPYGNLPDLIQIEMLLHIMFLAVPDRSS